MKNDAKSEPVETGEATVLLTDLPALLSRS